MAEPWNLHKTSLNMLFPNPQADNIQVMLHQDVRVKHHFHGLENTNQLILPVQHALLKMLTSFGWMVKILLVYLLVLYILTVMLNTLRSLSEMNA